MYNKKIRNILLLLIIITLSVYFAHSEKVMAVDYQPLVRIPGLPATGGVTLSMYLVGLYNFLLSIVGIVAVMMMILGGVRYITAAGSESTIGDAKSMITNAIFGLALAILSWVIVSTINPDVLFVKQPGDTGNCTAGTCSKIFCAGSNQCVCRDGNTQTATNPSECDTKCTNTTNCPPWSSP